MKEGAWCAKGLLSWHVGVLLFVQRGGEVEGEEDEVMDAASIEVPGGDDFKDLLVDDDEITALEEESKKTGGTNLEVQKRIAAGIQDAFRAKRAR